jgi:NAD(P)H dehydrogenase (quinone)
MQLHVFAMQMGMIWVGVGDPPGNNSSRGSRDDLNRLGTFMGAMGQSNGDEDRPSIGDVDTAERFGRRIGLITRRFTTGAQYDVERISEDKFREFNLKRKQSLEANH